MIEQNTIKILWLSDIHFRDTYERSVVCEQADKKKNAAECTNLSAAEQADAISKVGKDLDEKLVQLEKLDEMLTAFLGTIKSYCKGLAEKGEKLDYILISGDLAFAASDADYQLFEKKITSQLKTICGPRTCLLTIPGNHDVNWKGSGFFDYFISQMLHKSEDQIRSEYFRQRKEFLQGKNDLFRALFLHYSEYFKKNILPSLGGLEVCEDYKKHGLYGLVIDKENNLVINLLNSAWFALGQQFDTLLTEAIMRQYELLFKMYLKQENDEEFKKKFKDFVHFVITLKSATSEYGEQMLGDGFMKKDERFAKLEEYKGACVLSVFHHPINWLQFSEKYQMESQAHNDLFLTRLLKYTDMLLTGHEHVPASTISEKINRDIHHLKAGMFMQDNMFTGTIEGEHRFSILEIDTRRFQFSECKYVYDWTKKRYQEKSEHAIRQEPTRSKNPVLTIQKQETLLSKIKDPEVLKKVMGIYFWDDPVPLPSRRADLDTPHFMCFSIDSPILSERRYLVLVTDPLFFSGSFGTKMETAEQPHPLDGLIADACKEKGPVLVHIVTPDFHVDQVLTQRYFDGDSANQNYTTIVRKADFVFNIARHQFFSRFETSYRNSRDMPGLAVNGIGFDRIRDIRLTSQVVPFWGIERYG